MSLIPTVYGTGRRINFLNRFSSDLRNPSHVLPLATPSIDLKETPEAHVFKVELPGLKKREVKLEILWGRVLQISGDSTNKEKKERNGGIMSTWHRMERSGGGRFLRRFNLPENSKVDQLKAFMENGVLTISVPKEEFKKPYLKHVQITN